MKKKINEPTPDELAAAGVKLPDNPGEPPLGGAAAPAAPPSPAPGGSAAAAAAKAPADSAEDTLRAMGLPGLDVLLPIIQPLLQKTVMETLNSMNLAQVITNVAEKAVAERVKPLEEMAASLKTILASGALGQPAAGAAAPAGGGGDNVMGQLVQSFLMKQIQGNQGGGQMEQLMQMIKGFGEMSGAIMRPYLDARAQGMAEALQFVGTVQKNPDALRSMFGGENKT